jgi:hypothetical protein
VGEAFESQLSPDECRAVLTRELPAPPALRYRLDGKAMIAQASRPDGTLTVWNVPSGFSSPYRVLDVRIAPAHGGSTIEIRPRVAWSRVLVTLLFAAVLVPIVLVVTALGLPPLSPASPASVRSTDPLPLLALLGVLAVVLILVFVRYGRQRKKVDEDQVAARLRELLRAR